MRLFRFPALIVILVVTIFILAATEPPPTFQVTEEEKSELESAFTSKLQSKTSLNQTGLEIFTPEVDTAYKTVDGSLALLWLALRDDGGRILATEPGLALARKTDQGWEIIMPDDENWDELFSSIPEEM